MSGDPTRLLARTIHAARCYAGISRAQLGAKIGRTGDQVGRYERGEWQSEDGPDRLVLRAISEATGAPLSFLLNGFPDAFTRFAESTRREAERIDEHRESTPEDRRDADEEGEAR